MAPGGLWHVYSLSLQTLDDLDDVCSHVAAPMAGCRFFSSWRLQDLAVVYC